MYEYASFAISLIKKDYAAYLNDEAIKRLDSYITERKIKVKSFEEMATTGRKGTKAGCQAHTDGTIDMLLPANNIISETRRRLNTFTCILFTLIISILTFAITYFLFSKHF